MSNKTYVGKRVQSFESSPQFDSYTRVVIVVSDETEYSAGEETGRTLTIENPWGTQDMADNILASILGFRYQPYTATGALLDPAAELGDGVTVNGLYSGIYSIETNFGRLCRAKISAPSEEELDSEYPYVSKTERKIQRKISGVSAELKVQADRITATVTKVGELEETTSELSATVGEIKSTVTELTKEGGKIETIESTLTQHARDISAKVSKTGGSTSSFGWKLTDSDWTIQADGADVLKASKSGLEVYGKITAIDGKIGGFDILENYLSYNGLTYGSTQASGAYIGIEGIQLGAKFRVDKEGNLYAASGTFTGKVTAGNILYGTDTSTGANYGTLPGTALTASTVSTTQVTSGVNTSLGYANFSNDVFEGYQTAKNMYALNVQADDVYIDSALWINYNNATRKVSIESLTVQTDSGTVTKTFLVI